MASGIIPARAGFTGGCRNRSRRPRDHPRSRGVYLPRWAAEALAEGSSPLARGLRARRRARVRGCGIIPARAGFTSAMSGRTVRTSDHPRSRGVYPPPKRPATRGRGIIPARAGFTRPAARRRRADGDHPRSRGVYRIAWGSLTPPRGSSPLARGLQPCVTVVVVVRRIIPARAGFTCWPACRCAGERDHPRSRGVYHDAQHRNSPLHGSSPLARGLLRQASTLPSCVGIIPARAGFTKGSRHALGCLADHPRSRGVYTCGSLVSQRTRSLPDPRRLHCRPRARSAGSP